jgi:hypothetical protein
MRGRIVISVAGAIIIAIYMVVVMVCVYREFVIGSGPFGDYYGRLLLLTLPLSVLPWWFTWALMHDRPGRGFFEIMFFTLAALNSGAAAWVLYRLCWSRRTVPGRAINGAGSQRGAP